MAALPPAFCTLSTLLTFAPWRLCVRFFLGSAKRLTSGIPKLQQTRMFALGDALVVRGDQVVYGEDGGS